MEKWPADKEKLTFFLLIYIYILLYAATLMRLPTENFD